MIRKSAPVTVLSVVAALLIGASTVSAQPAGLQDQPAAPNPTSSVVRISPTQFAGDPRAIASAVLERVKGDNGEFKDPPITATPGALDQAVQPTGGAAPAPGSTTNFPGLDFNSWGAGWPPDTNGDVGQSYYIQTVNTSIGIFSKSTGTRVAAFTFNAFFDGTGTPCDASNGGDPVVVYDPLGGHWIISDFAYSNASGPFYQCFAVSKGEDPTATNGWWFYALQTNAGGIFGSFPDYPKLGVWPDGIYMTANLFSNFSGGFQNVRVWALNRAQLEAGLTTTVASTNLPSTVNGATIFSVLPSNVRGAAPPSGRPNLLTQIWGSGAVHVWKATVNWVTPSLSLAGPTTVSVAGWSTAPSTVPSLGGNNLDTLQERLMMQNQYRNIGGQESLWLTNTVAGPNSGQAAIRWYQLNVTGGTISTSPVQQSTYSPDSNSRFMASLAVDKNGDMAVGYSVSSSATYPAIRYSARLSSDPLNTLGLSETSLIEGTGSQNNTCGSGACSRWGDYSAMTVDPVDDCTFWYTNEYYVTSGGNWQTRIGSFTLSGCGSTVSTVPGAPTLNSATPGNGSVDVAWSAGTDGGSAITGYNLYRSTSSGTETLYQSLGLVTSYHDTGVTNGTTYFYKVSAVNINGEGVLSNERSATPATVPAAPTLNSATPGSGQVTLNWTAGSNGGSAITGYNIYRSMTSGAETFLTSVGNQTSYTDSALTGTTYFYKVSAVNAIGVGAQSNERSATPTNPTTPGPSALSATAGAGTVTLNWTAPVSDGGAAITGYNLYRGTASGAESATPLAMLGNVLTYTDPAVTAGTTYYYYAKAVNSVGPGTASNEVSATPTASSGAPGAPTLTAKTNNGFFFRGVKLSWTVPSSSSTITAYKIYRSTTSGAEALLTQVSGSTTSYNDTATNTGVTYYYKVTAVNASGEGPYSNEAYAVAR